MSFWIFWQRCLGNTAAEVPFKFQSNGTILNTNLAASRLHGILWWDGLSGSNRILKRVPSRVMVGHELWTRLGDSIASHSWMWSKEYGAENIGIALQGNNRASYLIKVYIFMANTTSNRQFLPSICVVMWIYLVHHSPWRVRIWPGILRSKRQVNQWHFTWDAKAVFITTVNADGTK